MSIWHEMKCDGFFMWVNNMTSKIRFGVSIYLIFLYVYAVKWARSLWCLHELFSCEGLKRVISNQRHSNSNIITFYEVFQVLLICKVLYVSNINPPKTWMGLLIVLLSPGSSFSGSHPFYEPKNQDRHQLGIPFANWLVLLFSVSVTTA